MDRSQLRYRTEWFAEQAKLVAKGVLQASRSFVEEERPRLAKARADVLDALPAGERRAAGPKLDAIVECADFIEQRRWDAWNANRKAEKMRCEAEADLKEAEIEGLIVDISGHLGSR